MMMCTGAHPLAGAAAQKAAQSRPSRLAPALAAAGATPPRRCRSQRRVVLAAAAAAGGREQQPAPGQFATATYGDCFPPPDPPRRAGVLLHPTSLPGPFGVGDLGLEAYAFADWLHETGAQIWQVLPLVPPDPEYWSPYSGTDAHCGNPLLVSLELLVDDGLLRASELPQRQPVAAARFPEYAAEATQLLATAADRLLQAGPTSPAGVRVLRAEFAQWRADPTVASWLEPAALFDAIQHSGEEETHRVPWWTWPAALRERQPAALVQARAKLSHAVDRFCAIQFFFDAQWRRLKRYCNGHGIALVGDMPIYVGADSADVWCRPQLWTLGSEVSGTPPDAFSETGQLWGSPLYDWAEHEKEGYAWWTSRMARALALHDEVRIDHFRGLAGYWAVPADAETALSGKWRVGPGRAFFDALQRNLSPDGTRLPIVAEDLGVITADVVELRQAINAPGMAVLQFAWDGNGKNPHLPHNHGSNAFVYTGTHDNETTAGWFQTTTENDRTNFKAYLGADDDPAFDPAWACMRLAMLSVARTVVVPMQDVLRLDNSARMNTPGVAAGNWTWRLGPEGCWAQLSEEARQFRRLAASYDRLAKGAPRVFGETAPLGASDDDAGEAPLPLRIASAAE